MEQAMPVPYKYPAGTVIVSPGEVEFFELTNESDYIMIVPGARRAQPHVDC